MLKQTLRPHRKHLKAGTADVQKVFAMLKLIPEADVARARPPVAFALVIDTSGSMLEFSDQERAREEVEGRSLTGEQDHSDGRSGQRVDLPLPTKLDVAIKACHALIDDTRLASSDRVSVIMFNDAASVLFPLGAIADKRVVHDAVDALRKSSGGTAMATGITKAFQELQSVPSDVVKRVILFTDGETTDEPECQTWAGRLAEHNALVIAIGMGSTYNDRLMLRLAETTRGRPYHLESMEQFHAVLEEEIGSSTKEVVTDLTATVATVKTATLESCTRVFPSLADVSVADRPLRLGNVSAGEETVFVLEFAVGGIARPASIARLAEVHLAGYAPGLQRHAELEAQKLQITFTDDARAVSEIDPEVMGYVQQKNVDRMVRDAVTQATGDPSRARQTLQVAVNMTQQLGNLGMTRILGDALDELNRTGAISSGTRKTVVIGSRTRTVKTAALDTSEDRPSAAEIRKATGI